MVNRQGSPWPGLLAWAVLGIILATSACRPRSEQPPTDSSLPGRDILSEFATDLDAISPGAFDRLEWRDIGPTVESPLLTPEVRSRVVALTSTTGRAPVMYLRGLLLLASDEPAAALDVFGRLAPQEIPALHLYAPYRLYGALHPRTPNPYLPAIRSAIETRRLPPLIVARVTAREGDLQAALQDYLRSDPAQWAGADLDAFRGMLGHAGLVNEATVMIRGALRGGRVPQVLRPRLVQLLEPSAPTESLDALKDNLGQALKVDGESRELLTTAAARQLEIRQRFAQSRYRELLEQHRSVDPVRQPNETVLLLFLSAAKEGDHAELDRWSQELKRRVPTEEVAQWIKGIVAEAR